MYDDKYLPFQSM